MSRPSLNFNWWLKIVDRPSRGPAESDVSCPRRPLIASLKISSVLPPAVSVSTLLDARRIGNDNALAACLDAVPLADPSALLRRLPMRMASAALSDFRPVIPNTAAVPPPVLPEVFLKHPLSDGITYSAGALCNRHHSRQQFPAIVLRAQGGPMYLSPCQDTSQPSLWWSTALLAGRITSESTQPPTPCGMLRKDPLLLPSRSSASLIL
ncbi:hypothetical protein C8R43DRAFT_1238967 [Mycena crocata]|nr:hypothetical protein C8R43DRAFT_1238967 [Mycena crocata]